MKQKIANACREFVALVKAVPALLLTFFVLAIISMNLLANKSISLPTEYLALDCGILVSWIVFLTMDIATKHFGPRAATALSVLALAINLLFCLVFFTASAIVGEWGESFVEGGQAINVALDNTFRGSWYVVLGSSVAFVASAVVNNFLNAGIGLAFKSRPDSLGAYVCRSYVSTAVGQFIDNIVFALIVSRVFFGWTTVQCLTCAATGMLVELLCEFLFAPLGFAVCNRLKRDGVGAEYFALVEANRNAANREEANGNGGEEQ